MKQLEDSHVRLRVALERLRDLKRTSPGDPMAFLGVTHGVLDAMAENQLTISRDMLRLFAFIGAVYPGFKAAEEEERERHMRGDAGPPPASAPGQP